jgi:hypothetical protein
LSRFFSNQSGLRSRLIHPSHSDLVTKRTLFTLGSQRAREVKTLFGGDRGGMGCEHWEFARNGQALKGARRRPERAGREEGRQFKRRPVESSWGEN